MAFGKVRAEIRRVMTTLEHQAMAKLLAESPRLVPVLMHRIFGYDVPLDVDVVPAPETVRNIRRPDLSVDGTVVLGHDRPSRREATAVEVQRRPDADKSMTWPVDVAELRRRLGCPVSLLVVTGSSRTARWARRPIDLGRGRMVLRPLVIGPREIPWRLPSHVVRQHPDLAVLSIIVHGRRHGSKRLGRMTLRAILGLARRGDPRATLLFDIVMAFLDPGVRKELVEEMDLDTDMPFSDFGRRHFERGIEQGRRQGVEQGRRQGRRQGVEEGRRQGLARGVEQGRRQGLARGVEQGLARGVEQGQIAGRARSLLLVLEARGIEVGARERQRILECTECATLDRWIERALVITRCDALFD